MTISLPLTLSSPQHIHHSRDDDDDDVRTQSGQSRAQDDYYDGAVGVEESEDTPPAPGKRFSPAGVGGMAQSMQDNMQQSIGGMVQGLGGQMPMNQFSGMGKAMGLGRRR